VKRRRVALIALAFLVPASLIGACGGDDGNVKTAPSGKGKAPPPPPPKPAAAVDAGAVDAASEAGAMPANLPPLPPNREFQDSDFGETDRSRDPFRAFEVLFVPAPKGRAVLQRNVLADRFSLEELKLIGIVTRAPARALLTDPSGLGWVARVGDFIGKAELVHSGGASGEDVAINWRVDRVRDTDVVLVREDAAHADIPSTTRVMALYPVDDTGNTPASKRP
jgi:type IV pilus assembly protein PilP